MMNKMKRGFTLAELLIALAILGVIATFTIPKVLNGQQSQKYNSVAKEAAATIVAAYQHYKITNGDNLDAMTITNLLPYLNYVRVYTTGIASYDFSPGYSGFYNCNAGAPCIRLHNGALIIYHALYNFIPYDLTPPYEPGIAFIVDPDGVWNGTNSVMFVVYKDSALRTLGTAKSNNRFSTVDWPMSGTDPSWFSWDN